MEPTYTMKGKISVIEVYEDRVCITSKGILAKAIRGSTAKKDIPLASVGCIRFKKPGLTSGYIQLVIQGENVGKTSFLEVEKDENALTFNTNLKLAIEIKGFIETRIANTPEQEMIAREVFLQHEKAKKEAREMIAREALLQQEQIKTAEQEAARPSKGGESSYPNRNAASAANRPIISMEGVASLLEVYKDKVCLTPKGAMGFLTQGLKGTKTIPFYSITAIQFKKTGLLSGYIQFTIPGGNEGRRGLLEAAREENTFMFAGDNDTALEIKEYVEKRMFELRSPSPTSGSPAPAQVPSLTEELKKLAELKEKGVLSDDEFLAAKKRLIT